MQVTPVGGTASGSPGSVRRPPFGATSAALFSQILYQYQPALPLRLTTTGEFTPAWVGALPYRIPHGGTSIGLDRAELAYEPLIQSAASRYGVPADLVRAVVRVESGFNPLAVSSAGAQGLMQLMPGTAQGLGVRNTFDPAENVDGGTRYLRRQLDSFGSVPLALAAYHAGPNAVREYGGIPPYPTTQRYVERVLELCQAGAGGSA